LVGIFISPELQRILDNKLKVGNRRVNVRVEVDKLTYKPDVYVEFDRVKFDVDGITPIDISPFTDIGYGISSLTHSGSSILISPIKDTTVTETLTKLSSDFQVMRVNGKIRKLFINGQYVEADHEGIDLAYGKGTEVVAVADGIVSKVSSENLRLINILHKNGFTTRYLHLGEIKVFEGQMVKQGEVIGTIGAKDRYSTGEHLHFEVRENSSKTSLGNPVDPKEFLTGKRYLENLPNQSFNVVVQGSVNTDNVRLRESASVGSTILNTLSKGTSVQILGRAGEWYHVSNNGTKGYVYGAYITLPNEFQSTGYEKPSRLDIINYITNKSKALNIPERLSLAVAWTESQMTQFNLDGTPFKSTYTNELSWGIMQIHEPSWNKTYNVNDLKYNWRYNIDAGLSIIKTHYTEAIRLNETDPIRATYSAYNTGSNYSRYRTQSDYRDINFWDHYQNSPWVAAGREILYGVVEGVAVPIRVSPDDSSSILKSVNKGEVLSYTTKDNNYYVVDLGYNATGYIKEIYFRPTSSTLSNDFEFSTIFYDDFNSYTPNLAPKNYFQISNTNNEWKVINENGESNLKIEGGGEGTTELSMNTKTNHNAKLEIEYSANLGENNFFRIYDNNRIVYSDSDTNPESVEEKKLISLSLSKGNHNIKLSFEKKTHGVNDLIKVYSVKVNELIYKGRVSKSLENEDLDGNCIYVKADGIDVYSTTDGLNAIMRLNRGNIFKADSITDEWVEFSIDETTKGYVRRNLVDIHPECFSDDKTRYRSGRFIHERTLELENIESVNIDFRYEMRMATATVVITNENGFYSPDYMPQKFPELGAKKSEFVEYDNGKPLGVLTDNTPIRIYIGYGDNPPRRFTGLIDGVDISGDSKTITIRCSDMLKKLANYRTYIPENYPKEGEDGTAWLASAIIHDLARRAGMNQWRTIAEDLNYPDIVIEQSYYTELNTQQGYFVQLDEAQEPYKVEIDSLAVEDGYKNPYIYRSFTITEGEVYADVIDDICNEIDFWQRADRYGTYYCTESKYNPNPSAYFKDTETISTINKTIDYTKVVNHIIIAGAGKNEHFLDDSLWKAVKGERRTARVEVPWANTYGKKLAIANKLFRDMKMRATTIKAVIEGNPYVELMDTIHIEDRHTTTKDQYVVKGFTDSWSVGSSYITSLELFWGEGL
jgi:uncharacterized protein YgiM (DUF1202 family)